ncbi:MAG: hypothetical protein LBK12_09200 [Odoribacteraceae bacterium]|jgi:hypothetical protein|nr:hypothetical protein [Odoribacteraceae bacterium]
MKTILVIGLAIAGAIACGAQGCAQWFPDEKLTIQRTAYTGNELRIDGYYYHFPTVPGGTIIQFFYRNGIRLTGRYSGTTNLDSVDMRIPEANSDLQHDKSGWGVFLISGNSIWYEKWDTSVGGGLPVTKSFGHVLNDTTFLRMYSIANGKKFIDNEIWHFRKFSLKPDSTNRWIQ